MLKKNIAQQKREKEKNENLQNSLILAYNYAVT